MQLLCGNSDCGCIVSFRVFTTATKGDSCPVCKKGILSIDYGDALEYDELEEQRSKPDYQRWPYYEDVCTELDYEGEEW